MDKAQKDALKKRAELIRIARENVLNSKDGRTFIGLLLADAGVFMPQTDPAKIAVQQFFIKQMGKWDLYTTNSSFIPDFINSLMALPRSTNIPEEQE